MVPCSDLKDGSPAAARREYGRAWDQAAEGGDILDRTGSTNHLGQNQEGIIAAGPSHVLADSAERVRAAGLQRPEGASTETFASDVLVKCGSNGVLHCDHEFMDFVSTPTRKRVVAPFPDVFENQISAAKTIGNSRHGWISHLATSRAQRDQTGYSAAPKGFTSHRLAKKNTKSVHDRSRYVL